MCFTDDLGLLNQLDSWIAAAGGLSETAACHYSSQRQVLRGESFPSISFGHQFATGSCFVSAHWKFHYWNFRANFLRFFVWSCGSHSLSVFSPSGCLELLKPRQSSRSELWSLLLCKVPHFTWLLKIKISGHHLHLLISIVWFSHLFSRNTNNPRWGIARLSNLRLLYWCWVQIASLEKREGNWNHSLLLYLDLSDLLLLAEILFDFMKWGAMNVWCIAGQLYIWTHSVCDMYKTCVCIYNWYFLLNYSPY